MRNLTIMLILLGSTLIGYSGNSDLIKDCQKIIIRTFRYGDSNPIYQPETDSIQSNFQSILLRRGENNIVKNNSDEIKNLFDWLYNSCTNEYDDSPDYRRLKMRRAMCFASIGLISDFDKAYTFLEYAKVSIIGEIDNPDYELLEDSFLGLMIIETMLKIEENKLTKYDILKLEKYLSNKKDLLDKLDITETENLIMKCKLKIN